MNVDLRWQSILGQDMPEVELPIQKLIGQKPQWNRPCYFM